MSGKKIFTRLGNHFIRFTYSNGNHRFLNLNQIENIHFKRDKNEIDFNGPAERSTGVCNIPDINKWESELNQVLADYSPNSSLNSSASNTIKEKLTNIEGHMAVIAESVKKPPPKNPFEEITKKKNRKGRMGVWPPSSII